MRYAIRAANGKASRVAVKERGWSFRFSSRLERTGPGGTYAVRVPARISSAIGKRGPVPVTAEIEGTVELTASLSPAGGGRHLLRLNASIREAAKIVVGDRVSVRLRVHARAPVVSIPGDLAGELKSEGALESFQMLAAGKQRHILDWIDQAARPETRRKRIRLAVEVAHRKREKLARKAGREKAV